MHAASKRPSSVSLVCRFSLLAMPGVLSPSDWLTFAAESGYCAKTPPGGGAGDCIAGDHGSWGLKTAQSHTVLDAATACLEHCSGCSRCNYITISAEWKHCSWHHQCREPLLDDAPNFISGAAHKKAAQAAARNATGAGHNRSEAMKGEPARKRDLRSAISRVKYNFVHCPKGAAPPPTAELDDWMDSPRNSFLAGYAALHHAACCGGVGVLPRINSEQSSRDPKRNTMVGVLGARQKAPDVRVAHVEAEQREPQPVQRDGRRRERRRVGRNAVGAA